MVDKVSGITESNASSIQLNKKVTNPFINTVFNLRTKKGEAGETLTVREMLYEQAANLPANIREKYLEFLEKGETKRDFIDMLNERYEKKQAEFEAAWAEYQASKDNLKLLTKIYETLEKKYANSDSDFEQSKVELAFKNARISEMSTDALLGKCSDIAHRIV